METEDPATENIFWERVTERSEIWEKLFMKRERENGYEAGEHKDCEKPQIANKTIL